jgi:hypothetical protein
MIRVGCCPSRKDARGRSGVYGKSIPEFVQFCGFAHIECEVLE